MDWSDSMQDYSAVKCFFYPRGYDSVVNQYVDDNKEVVGSQLFVCATSLLDDDGLYPGEFTLCACDSASRKLFNEMGLSWITSQDVITQQQIDTLIYIPTKGE